MSDFEFHPIANLFPLIEGEDFDRLCADIKRNGLRQNIILFEDKILDGRNRYRACLAVGVKPRVIEYLGDDPFGYVAALNLLRRHLSPTQRAMIAAEMATMKRGGDGSNQHQSKYAHVQISSLEQKSNDLAQTNKTAPLSEGSAPGPNLISQADAAERMKVSTRVVASAAKIIEQGTLELIEAVKADTISVRAAEAIVSLPVMMKSEPIRLMSSSLTRWFRRIRLARTTTWRLMLSPRLGAASQAPRTAP